MSDYKEVRHENLYVRVPGSDRLRKTAEGRLKYLLANGWRETERWEYPNFVTVRVERSGHAPRMTKLPAPPPQQARGSRFGGGFRGGPGGPRRGEGGGPGQRGPGGGRGPGQGAGGAGTGTSAGQGAAPPPA